MSALTTNPWSATTSAAERGQEKRKLYAILMNVLRGNIPKAYMLLILGILLFSFALVEKNVVKVTYYGGYF